MARLMVHVTIILSLNHIFRCVMGILLFLTGLGDIPLGFIFSYYFYEVLDIIVFIVGAPLLILLMKLLIKINP